MNYCKITTTKQAQIMPNPVHLTIANPTENQKATVAELGDWLPMVYTEPPEYDPETQHVTDYWEEEDEKAVQKWEIHDKPPEPEPDPTIEDRVDNLEEAVDGILRGETA